MSKSTSNVLNAYFDPSVNQYSPTRTDYVRVVKYDEKSGEYVVWEPFDSAEYQASLGPVEYWSLENLLKAGIDPKFGIHTGYNTRLEGVADLERMVDVADSLAADITNNETKTE